MKLDNNLQPELMDSMKVWEMINSHTWETLEEFLLGSMQNLLLQLAQAREDTSIAHIQGRYAAYKELLDLKRYIEKPKDS